MLRVIIVSIIGVCCFCCEGTGMARDIVDSTIQTDYHVTTKWFTKFALKVNDIRLIEYRCIRSMRNSVRHRTLLRVPCTSRTRALHRLLQQTHTTDEPTHTDTQVTLRYSHSDHQRLLAVAFRVCGGIFRSLIIVILVRLCRGVYPCTTIRDCNIYYTHRFCIYST